MNPLITTLTQAFKRNLIPALVLPLFCLLLLWSYWETERGKAFWDGIASAKAHHGWIAAALAGVLFGGLLPFLYLFFRGAIPRGFFLAQLAFYLGFWFWRSLEVDFLYQTLAHWWGDRQSFGVVTKKVLFDQFVYVPLWSAPTTALLFGWKDRGFSLDGLKALCSRGYWIHD